MKKRHLGAMAVLLALSAPQASEAIPYASLIRVGTTQVAQANGTTISYVLNEDADSVLIEVLDSADAVVASFAGTTDRGRNSVAWDGTDDNDGGTPLSEDTGYRVRITVDKNVAAGWYSFSSNGTGYQSANPDPERMELLEDGFIKDLAIPTDPDSDLYGTIVTSMGKGSESAFAWFVLNTALDVADENDVSGGLDSRVLKHPRDGVESSGTYSHWGGAFDPTDSNRFFATGQPPGGDPELFTAANENGYDEFMTNIDDSPYPGALLPRTISIWDYAGTKYAFLARGNGVISVVELASDNTVAAYTENILDGTTVYSKAVRFDPDGNLYWVGRRSSGNVGGKLYRWDAATAQAAIADPTGAPLTPTNADWDLDVPDIGGYAVGIGVAVGPDGTVYYSSNNGGIYDLGAYDQTTPVTGTMGSGVGTLAVDYATINPGGGLTLLEYASNIATDAVGNIYMVDGRSEAIYGFAPGGTTSESTTAPASQTFEVVEFTSASGWEMYQ